MVKKPTGWWNSKFERETLSRLDQMEQFMSQMHDSILQTVQALIAEVKTLREAVTKLAGENTQNEQSFQDVKTQLEQANTELKDLTTLANQALTDDASTGGSTGGGSGAR